MNKKVITLTNLGSALGAGIASQRKKMHVTELTIREGREYAERYPCQGNGPMCNAKIPLPLPGGATFPYRCTREAEHDGPHVAHVTRGAIATWEPGGADA